MSNRKLIEILEEKTRISKKYIKLDYYKLLDPFNEVTIENNILDGITPFDECYVIQILMKIKPITFDKLKKLNEILNGTCRWRKLFVGNLLENHKIEEIFSSEEDIITYLRNKELSEQVTYEILKLVQSGKLYQEQTEYLEKVDWYKYKSILKEHNVDDWIIYMLENIGNVLQKNQQYNYLEYALILVWYKLYHKREFEQALNEIRGVKKNEEGK